jgi:hypothetical protein
MEDCAKTGDMLNNSKVNRKRVDVNVRDFIDVGIY